MLPFPPPSPLPVPPVALTPRVVTPAGTVEVVPPVAVKVQVTLRPPVTPHSPAAAAGRAGSQGRDRGGCEAAGGRDGETAAPTAPDGRADRVLSLAGRGWRWSRRAPSNRM